MNRKLRDSFFGRKSRKTVRTIRKARLTVELLEDRLNPSWAGVPPADILPPANALGVLLNSQGDASGYAAISFGEVDYYRFTAAVGGSYTFAAADQSGTLDTVLGVFSSIGQRVGY